MLLLQRQINKRAIFSDRKIECEEQYMILKGTILVLAKLSTPWSDNNGNSRISYTINVAQDSGKIIDRLKVSKEHWEFTQGKPILAAAAFSSSNVLA